ncbi:uncharacterized protein LOC128856642 [Anastrepha ludens]|uniref:uncharacterized protein LOC128856642 n=1 Tax=Anastrepha ludens TaxID=28586 RepID=UPI0023B0FF31|nr:uncharacterized protein LOC128856642 [Anastrepha ludens]
MESILLSNIAAIIVKDILIDNNTKNKPHECETNDFPLLSRDTEDEALVYFFKRKRKKPQRSSVESEMQTTSKSRQYISIKDAASNSTHTHITQYEPSNRRMPLEINLINEFNSTIFEGYLHMSKMTFLRIFKRLRQYLPYNHYPTAAPPQSIFSLALWKLSTNEHFEDISRKFSITKHVCQQVIRLFWRRISAQYEALIVWPSTPEKRNYTIKNFQSHQQLQRFNQIFGIIAIKQLDVFLTAENEERQVILQIICDADKKVIDCFFVLASEYSFDASPIGQTLALNVQTMPAGSYLIGDQNFPLKPYLMRPIGAPSDDSERAFNAALLPALQIGEQVLDAMATRFNVLYSLEARNLHEARKIIDTICALHNLCVEMEDDYVDRKLKDIQFNWAKVAVGVIKKTEVEEDTQGRQKRNALMEYY